MIHESARPPLESSLVYTTGETLGDNRNKPCVHHHHLSIPPRTQITPQRLTLTSHPSSHPTPTSQAAFKQARQHLHPWILNHSIRVYLLAHSLASREQNTTWTSEDRLALLFTACILHDIGTTPTYDGPDWRFEIEGARTPPSPSCAPTTSPKRMRTKFGSPLPCTRRRRLRSASRLCVVWCGWL